MLSGLSSTSCLYPQEADGRRVYRGVEEVPEILAGIGVAVVSTSKGLMTDTKAREQRVGGEVMCRVW